MTGVEGTYNAIPAIPFKTDIKNLKSLPLKTKKKLQSFHSWIADKSLVHKYYTTGIVYYYSSNSIRIRQLRSSIHPTCMQTILTANFYNMIIGHIPSI